MGWCNERALIIGAGQAGGECAAQLRQNGWSGAIDLVGAEPYAPYQRPPLSKAYLSDATTEDRLLLKPHSYYADEEIGLRLGVQAATIDRFAGMVSLEDGSTIAYTKLFLATGTRPRRLDLPGSGLDGVGYLRGIDDVKRLKPLIRSGTRLVVVGGGYVGLEVAAIARKLGVLVTVLEAGDRVLGRVTSPPVSEFYTRLHRANGVDVVLNAELITFRGGRHVGAAVLKDGREIPCDVAVVGIGVVANEEMAIEAGIDTDNGILVDDVMRTSDPDIYAIGDCARGWSDFAGGHIRLESVANALEQARIAARHACGVPAKPREVPWFWSDQYDLKLQTAGITSSAYDQTVLRGETSANKFSVFYLNASKLVALDAVNSPLEFNVAK